MIISRATPAALLMHTAGLGKGWARTAGSPVWIPSGTQRRGHGRSLPQSPGDAALPFIEPKPWRSAGTVLPGRWPRSRETWLLSALHGTASSSRGQLQEMEIPQSWCQHPSLAQPAHGWPPHRPCTEQDPEPSAPRAAASLGQGCRSASCNPCVGRPGKPRSGLHRDLRYQSSPHHPVLLGPCPGGPAAPPALPGTRLCPLQLNLGDGWDGVPREMRPK